MGMEHRYTICEEDSQRGWKKLENILQEIQNESEKDRHIGKLLTRRNNAFKVKIYEFMLLKLLELS